MHDAVPDIVSPGTAGSRTRRRPPEWLLVIAAAVLLAVIMTWPMAPKLSRMGRVDTTDGMYAMWNVAWVAHSLTTNPIRVFDANIFHPHKGTLAFSESNLLTGALGIPAWLMTMNVYATYNSVTLIGFMLSFICMYALARRLTGSILGAAVAAIGFAYYPYIYARFPHIQLQMTFGLPLSLLAMHALVDRPSWRRGVGLGAALAAQGLTCAYYGILAGLAVGMGVLFFAGTRRLWTSTTYWVSVGTALVTCLVLIVPLFVPYLTIQEAGFARSLDEAREYSFGWQAWLASGVHAHAWMLPWLRDHGWKGNGVLFPGFLTVILGLAGFLLARRREISIYYVLLGAIGLWLTLGPGAGLYTVMYYTVPIFKLLRAPERFGIAVALALSIGSGFAATWLASRGRLRWGQVGFAAAAAALLVLSIADKLFAPLKFRDALPVASPYYMLARLPKGAVAEFPFFDRSIDLHRHSHYMFFSTYHWQPLINGYSDHMPKDFLDSVNLVKDFPHDPRVFDYLRTHEARYIVIHMNWFEHRRVPRIEEGLRHYVAEGVLRFIERDRKLDTRGVPIHDVALYEVLKYPG